MAILVRKVTAEIANLDFEFIPKADPNQIIVKGDIVTHTSYVTNTGLVRQQNDIAPFTVTLEIPGLTPEMNLKVNGNIKHISHRLINNGSQVEHQIIISITVVPELRDIQITKHFLIRHEETLNDPEEPEQKPEFKTLINEDTEQKEENNKPEIIPIPNLELLIEEKVQKFLEEIEESLAKEFEIKLEKKIQDQIARLKAEEHKTELEKKLQLSRKYENILKKSIQQQRKGFKIKG
ncbi:hypothetical protein BBF96_06790 [Anoxybacter fermentans]|uniref:SipL SPOCS domain-containing protein n=1 Tax=Anoxybacter fermentans TaxID=1323375 RepID=A0A3S9SXP2_9FIRM|nr:DUF3794 domain-containing protein [Anoxybacter fermentans]AZR73116.1 hypothetical protein BBF96_06790 [Anoxybacter fermentans]